MRTPDNEPAPPAQHLHHVFDGPLNQANIWLHEINEAMGGWMTDDYALQALRAALHPLRDDLTVERIAHLSAQLPMIIRGIFFEDWEPADVPARVRSEEAVLGKVLPYFRGKARIPDSRDVLRAVYRVLHHHITQGESLKIYNGLPAHIKKYWPAQMTFAEIETPAPQKQQH